MFACWDDARSQCVMEILLVSGHRTSLFTVLSSFGKWQPDRCDKRIHFAQYQVPASTNLMVQTVLGSVSFCFVLSHFPFIFNPLLYFLVPHLRWISYLWTPWISTPIHSCLPSALHPPWSFSPTEGIHPSPPTLTYNISAGKLSW